MSISVIMHLANDDPVVGEMENMPAPQDQVVILQNPRMKDGNDLHYLDAEVTTMIIPWHRITFIEIVPTAGIEEVITFVREE
ncbi:MAG: hypothetical protein ACK2T3_08845 [Candidatus Promineifilaceae bacterium]|jgi:hypothetical protein